MEPGSPFGAGRTPWLALALDGPALALASTSRKERLRVVDDPIAFRALVEAWRPRIVIAGAPPACDVDEELLARERRRRPSLRIVHLSPADAVETRLRALRLGFDEALPITVTPAELDGRLLLLDGQARPRSGSRLVVADGCELDLIAHELRRDGRIVHLRPKEYRLLAMLAAHPGRAYSRRQLLDRAWGHDHDGDPRTVDVHVRWLRSKIEPTPDRPVHLVTVRGVGYRLDPPPV
jgi:DNA-binding response OmpR family regulator